jgi:glyoxylase-like metal-dependent hydrolase (beta-lactamase superfamily II)
MAKAPSRLRFPWSEPPASGEAREVAEGIFWVRLPLPFRLNHVNIWLLKEDDGWTVVDTGCATVELLETWEVLLATVMQGQPVRRVVSTHGHVDHIGLAGWLVNRFRAEFVSTFGEWCWARLAHMHDVPGARDAYFRHLVRHGIDDAMAEEMVGNRGTYIDLASPIPGSISEIRDGGRIRFGNRDWEIFVTPGHSFEHASFLDRQAGIWIAGDHLLPKISPVIAVYEMLPDADPLGDYLASFDRFADFDAEMMVLPSHGSPYHGVHQRIDELRRHHAERLDATIHYLDAPKSSFQLSQDMFPHVEGAESVGFALGETIAHINYLVARGIVEKIGPTGGRLEFRATTAARQGSKRAGGMA